MLSGLWIPIVCLLFAVPAHAYSGTGNGGNGGLGNGMGTHDMQDKNDGYSANSYGNKTYLPSNDGTTARMNDGTAARTNHDVSIYGTGTGTQFLHTNDHAATPVDRTPGYRMESSMNGEYRALETTSSNGSNWGWLGLLGLVGLFGMRSRNPQRER